MKTTEYVNKETDPGKNKEMFLIQLDVDNIKDRSVIARDYGNGEIYKQHLFIQKNLGEGKYEVVLVTKNKEESYPTEHLKEGINYALIAFSTQV